MRLDLGLEETERMIAERSADWSRLIGQVIADCHPAQRAFVDDPHRRISAIVGRGGGKTTGQRARLVLRMLRTPKARCLYIAVTRDHAERLMWAPLKDLLERLGFRAGIDVVYNETKLRCTFKRNGATLWLFGADDKREIDKLRGQPFHEVCIDEAASHAVELLRNLILRIIGPRLGDFGGCIVLVGTPGHVLQGLFYDVTRPGSDAHRAYADRELPEFADWAGWSSHAWTLQDGAQTVPAMARLWREALLEKRANTWSDDNPVWLREYLGQWAADDTENVFRYRPLDAEGHPFNQWDPERRGPDKFAVLPSEFADWAYVYAMDLGHADPFGLNVFAFSPSDPGRHIWHVYGFEKTKMYAQAIAYLLIGEGLQHEAPGGVMGSTGWPDAIVADLAGNGASIIEELTRVYGIRVVAAEKKHKFSAIEVCNGDLVDGRLHILKGSKLEGQLMALQWKMDEFGRLKEDPAQANHSTDCLIYARHAISRLISIGTLAPPARQSTQSSRDPADADREHVDPRDDFSSILGDDPAFEDLFRD